MTVISDLENKAVLITGASTGIGAAAARAFGANKCRVAVHYNSSRAEAEQVAADVEAVGGKAIVIQGDVTRPEVADRVVEETVGAFGGLDVLINNAGSLVGRTPVQDYTEEFVEAVIGLNVTQVIRFMRAGSLAMRSGGAIINVGSIAGRNGGGPGAALYAASKGFIATATRGWARELAKDDIRVNAVSPGVILTPFHERFSSKEQLAATQKTIPMDRLGIPDDCTGAFLYLASDALSGYVTGQIIEVNGGQYMP